MGKFKRDMNSDWFTSEASDNLKMLDQFKFHGSKEGLRLPHNQATALKALLDYCNKHNQQKPDSAAKKAKRTTKTINKTTHHKRRRKPSPMKTKPVIQSTDHVRPLKTQSSTFKINVVPV
jgi:hypothetical protein